MRGTKVASQPGAVVLVVALFASGCLSMVPQDEDEPLLRGTIVIPALKPGQMANYTLSDADGVRPALSVQHQGAVQVRNSTHVAHDVEVLYAREEDWRLVDRDEYRLAPQESRFYLDRGLGRGVARDRMEYVNHTFRSIFFGGDRIDDQRSTRSWDAGTLPCPFALLPGTIDLAEPGAFMSACYVAVGNRSFYFHGLALPSVRAVAYEDVGGRPTVRFDLGQHTMWLRHGVPVPIRLAVHGGANPAYLTLESLSDAPIPPLKTIGPDAIPAMGATTRLGPPGDGGGHPFSLETAFQFAQDNPTWDELRTFQSAHPEWYLAYADFDEHVEARRVFEGVEGRSWDSRWLFVVTDGIHRLPFTVTDSPTYSPVPDEARGPGYGVWEESPSDFASYVFPERGQVPPLLPSRRTVEGLWRAHTGETGPGTSWGFRIACTDACTNVQARVYAGEKSTTCAQDLVPPYPLSPEDCTLRTSMLTLDAEGRAFSLGTTLTHRRADPWA